jgi:hypothetical protein
MELHLINFINFNVLIIPFRALQYLDQRVGIVFRCSRRHPGDGDRVPKHVGV